MGMWGYSDPGITAARVAAEQAPHLEAIVPASTPHDAYRDVMSPGGMLASQDAALLPLITAHTDVRQRRGTDPQRGTGAVLHSLTTSGGTCTLPEPAATRPMPTAARHAPWGMQKAS